MNSHFKTTQVNTLPKLKNNKSTLRKQVTDLSTCWG